MADQKTPKTSTGGLDERQKRDHVPQKGEVIGRDVPDESKERHTEIAVEVGREGGEHNEKKP